MRSRSAFLNAACAPQILEKQAVKCGGAPVPVHSITISVYGVLRHHVQDGRGHRMGIEHAFDSMLQYLQTGGFLQSRAHCYIWSDIDGNPSSGRFVAMAYDFKKEFGELSRPPDKPSILSFRL